MKRWYIDQSWQEVLQADSSHEKVSIFQKMLMSIFDECFPEKVRTITSDDQPWICHKLKILDRKRKRIYRKERRSEKWKKMEKLFKMKL